MKQKVNQARQDAPIAFEIKKTFDKDKQPNDEQLKELVKLDKEITKTKDNKTPRAKVKLKELEEQYKKISDAIQEPSTEKVDVQEPAPDSEAVGEGDTQQQPIAGEITSEQIEPEAKPTEEIEVEAEVTPSEIETYSLPENPIEAKKDFEILDNRDGLFQELEEDGSNKWIVRNIKTDFIGTTNTKTEAQQFLNNTVKREGMTMDYGEGQPVLEEFRAKVTEEVVESTIEAAPTDKVRQIGNFEVIITEDNVIKSITKDGKQPNTNKRNEIIKQIFDEGFVKLDESVTDLSNVSEQESTRAIIDLSKNPREVANTLKQERENRKNKTKSQLLSENDPFNYLNKKLTQEDFAKYNDIENITPNIKRFWINKEVPLH